KKREKKVKSDKGKVKRDKGKRNQRLKWKNQNCGIAARWLSYFFCHVLWAVPVSFIQLSDTYIQVHEWAKGIN
ncbi:MAG: hypothetical protein ACYS91_06575, partial [Planctomycetota bacterium]